MESLTEESYSYKQDINKASAELEELKTKTKQIEENERMEKGRLLRLLTVCRNLLLERNTEGLTKFAEGAIKSLMMVEKASVYLVDEDKGELITYGGDDVGGMEIRVPKGKGGE